MDNALEQNVHQFNANHRKVVLPTDKAKKNMGLRCNDGGGETMKSVLL